MRIVFFAHPTFIGHQSMPRFAQMLANGMANRGHEVEIWAPKPFFTCLPAPKSLKKWLGYLDQYGLFISATVKRIKRCSVDTLFVFTDQALGPWIPLATDRPHVIHCHDFLAQQSARGEIAENKISWTGRLYQSYIHKGYSKGKYFISVSKKTQDDLHTFLPSQPRYSKVVYNGLNQDFDFHPSLDARKIFSQFAGMDLVPGYILHVGGNHFYKNRIGVIEIYNSWRSAEVKVIPLILIGEEPNANLLNARVQSAYAADILFLSGLEDEMVRLAYAGASVLLFPSLAEGFGWPIAEAMASGCPVITTGEAPMTEVAGEAAFFISRKPYNSSEAKSWADKAAVILGKVINLSVQEREYVVRRGKVNADRFNSEKILDSIEECYQCVLNLDKN
jgi:glycosyltransferase involved in cell wall biosynthesis